ncbi:hypothetical protein H0H93_015859 [Arthromyces matolae]|nr:hypothetical protein H0H93_015859 [Arthromyces matolae]
MQLIMYTTFTFCRCQDLVTLLLTAIFALAGGGSPNFVALSSFAAVWSIGVGGNLPVDSATFLGQSKKQIPFEICESNTSSEFIPASHQYLLTVLSIWWALGQLLASRGWRYFLFAMGGLMFVLWGICFFIFKLHESPKYLMGRGQDEMAVEVVPRVAEYNGTTSGLVLEDIAKAGDLEFNNGKEMDTSARAAVARNLASFDAGHVKSLFATRKLAYFDYSLGLATTGADFGDGSLYITYRNQVILSVISVPGALLAGYMVELPILGRRGTFALSTGNFTSNVMYGVLYAITPELFLTKDRGTGNAIVAAANRVFVVMGV